MYYSATAQQGKSVLDSLVWNDHLTLVQSHALALYKWKDDIEQDLTFNARISGVLVLGDQLILSTEKHSIVVLSRDLKTRLSGSIREPTGRPAEGGHFLIKEPRSLCIASHAYQGILKIMRVYQGSHDFTPFAQIIGKGKSVVRGPAVGDLGQPCNFR